MPDVHGRSRAGRSAGGGGVVKKRTYEPTEFVAFVHRVVKSAGRRVETEGDAADLAELAALRTTVDAAVLTAVRGLRERGYSWGQIGAEIGVTRQAAQQTFGSKLAERVA